MLIECHKPWAASGIMYSEFSVVGLQMIYCIFSAPSWGMRSIHLRWYKYVIRSQLRAKDKYIKSKPCVFLHCINEWINECVNEWMYELPWKSRYSQYLFYALSSDTSIDKINLTWHVQVRTIQQSPCQSHDLFLSSLSSSRRSDRVLVTHMANYRWKWRRWCELKACSHMAGVRTPCGCLVESNGRENVINSWVPLRVPWFLSLVQVWCQIKDHYFNDQ